MWHTKNETALATATSATNLITECPILSSGGANVCEASTFSAATSAMPSTYLSNHHITDQQPQRSLDNFSVRTTSHSSFPQQHPPAKVVYRLKSLVSKKKKRFQADGFDLDLSYISSRIIAMGFPAERIEGLYRNHIDEVSRFFELRHKGHYKIYHLCNERDFDEYRFSGPVVRYPFSDHNAPQFEQILALCQDVMQFLNIHPENVVAINCKAGKGRTGVMVCACLMELQEARNAEEALRLYAEKRTRNGQGVTIPSQRRYVQYYSRLLSSGLTYEPTPLRLTSIRIEGLPHQLHGVQNFELSISTYQNRLSANSHSQDSAQVEDTSHIQRGTPGSPVAPSTLGIVNAAAVDSNLMVDYDFHRHSDVNTYQIPCSTHHSDSGSYLIRLDEPITVFEDFRIKIKARSGVLTKKIGQCWLNTFFILLDDGKPIGNRSSNETDINTAVSVPLAPTTSTVDNCSTSDSNSGSGSSSDSSASAESSASSSVRNSPPHFAGLNGEGQGMYAEGEELEGEGVPDPESLIDGIDEGDGDGLPMLNSNSATLDPTSPIPQNSIPTPQYGEILRRSSNPLWFGSSKIVSGPIIGASGAASMPFISVPKKDSSTTTFNFTKKGSPSATLVLAPSLSTQLATPLAVRVLELSQSDLDAAIKSRGKKGGEFKVIFEFIRETPCLSQPPSTCRGNFCGGVSSSNPTINITTTTATTPCCSNQKLVPMDFEGERCVDDLTFRRERRILEGAAESFPTSCLPSHHHHRHHHHNPHRPFHPPTESTTNHTGALVL